MLVEEGKYYLYRHIRLDKNEPFYIGIGTKCLNYGHTYKRIYSRAHTSSSRNSIWKRIAVKVEYEIEILMESDDYEFIKQKEIEFIALYGRLHINTGILSNLTCGGDASLGKPQTEESKRKKSESLKGRKLSQKTLKKLKANGEKVISNNRKKFLGRVYKMNQGCNAEIIDYKGANEVTIRFIETGLERICTLNEVVKGTLKDYFYPSSQNIGYVGGEVTNQKAHDKWITLTNSIKNKHKLSTEFENFQSFTRWFEKNHIDGWDLCINSLDRSVEECSSETCYYLPRNLNTLLLPSKGYNISKHGIITAKFNNKHLGSFKTTEEAIERYKEVKKEHILKIADNYKNILPIEVYEKIINYEIQIKK